MQNSQSNQQVEPTPTVTTNKNIITTFEGISYFLSKIKFKSNLF
jgi:hypothetical protein